MASPRRRLLLGAVAAYSASVSCAYYVSKRLRGGAESAGGREEGGGGMDDDEDRSSTSSSTFSSSSTSTFSRLAPKYDAAIDTDETLMGLKLLRRFTLGGRGGATGDVLEVCAGTSRNMRYYKFSNGVSSITLAEPSREMLAEARQKAIKLSEGSKGKDLPRMNFVLARAESLVLRGEQGERSFGPSDAFDFNVDNENSSSTPPLPAPGRFPPNSFDTVVDTFGLCSVEDPQAALKEMALACKPGGKMIFIEHGRATTETESCPSCSPPDPSPPDSSSPFPLTKAWIDAKLDEGAQQHRKKWGCWWNRDLEKEIRRCEAVEVESVGRWHFGTTLVVVARPKREK